MSEFLREPGSPTMGDFLEYRPFRGRLRGPMSAVWAIARTSLGLLFRRKLFWGLYLLGLIIFFLYFFGQYLLVWAGSQDSGQAIRVGPFARIPRKELIDGLRNMLKMDGSPGMFHNFLQTQGSIVMVIFALAGAQLVGNDFRFRSFPFYFSKPIGTFHYLLGKGMAAAVLLNMLTTIPALVLFFQAWFLGDWSWSEAKFRLFLSILGYGAILTWGLVPLLLASSAGLTRTIPIAMFWIFSFLFLHGVAEGLVDRLGYPANWKALDLWNDLGQVGSRVLGVVVEAKNAPKQPDFSLVLGIVLTIPILSFIYLKIRLSRVEVLR